MLGFSNPLIKPNIFFSSEQNKRIAEDCLYLSGNYGQYFV